MRGSLTVESWAVLLDRVRGDARCGEARGHFLAAAAAAALRPIVRRARTLAEVGSHRTFRYGNLDQIPDENREQFALAMSDHEQNGLADELPLLAAAYRLEPDRLLLSRILAQLTEMATWSPLQRPGWTLYAPGSRLPPGGRDGNWLGTGFGVRAIATTLEILPSDVVAEALRSQFLALLEHEIADTVADWQTERMWFVRGHNPRTNQWLLPLEGLVRACLCCGLDRHRQAYDYGLEKMLEAFEAHGAQGEFEEGVNYSRITLESMLHTMHAAAVAGDDRLLRHPYVRRYNRWLVHQFQPGDFLVNCFDAFWAARGGHARYRGLFALSAICLGNRTAHWALRHLFSDRPDDLPSLAALAVTAPEALPPPPLFATYERACLVVWRDSWARDSTGVWVRGGHRLDQHDHLDRGHINYIHRGRPILIEAGTPHYEHPWFIRFNSVLGHNVLQVGTAEPAEDPTPAGQNRILPGWQQHAPAPIVVRRLDAGGGDIRVDGSQLYDEVQFWFRDVRWSAHELRVEDEVVLVEPRPDILLFRWHLGSDQPPTITGSGSNYQLAWADAVINVSGTAPLCVTCARCPDHTLTQREWHDRSPDHQHACLLVRSRDAVSSLRVVTTIDPTAGLR